jgi:putative membrane protein
MRGDMGGGWFMAGGGLLLVLLIVVVVAVLMRQPTDHTGPREATGSAEDVLAERFARGEIDENEYRQRLGTLRN